MLRTLIIDDNPHFLESFSGLLGGYPGVSVVGVASNGVQGLRAAAELAPDLVFVDLKMPGTGGFEVAAQLRRQRPQTRVVIISLHDDAEYRARAVAAGAERFVCKQKMFDELSSIVGGAAASPGSGAVP